MTVKTRAQIKAENSTDLPDNTARLISPAGLRGQMDDIVDSAVFPEDGSAGGGNSTFLHPDLPSAVTRPWVQRGRERCSPFDIITNQDDQDEILSGAGTFDATTALQEAFAWAKRVEFPGGIQAKPAFLVSDALYMQDDQTLKGNGCRLIMHDAGWPMVGTDRFGLFQNKNKSRWRIEGFHVHYPPSVNAGIGNTPKAVYSENGTDGWIVGNIFEGTKFETIWQGGDTAALQRLHIINNTFIDCGRGDATWTGLPALQMNFVDGEAIGNNFLRPGTGIGNSGSRNVVVGNVVEDPHIVGIGIGDGHSQEANVMCGNRVRIFSHPTQLRMGIFIDDGAGTPASGVLASCDGNYVHVVGTHGHVMPTAIRTLAKIVSLGKNIITGEGEFTGIQVLGNPHIQIDIDGLTVRALTETGTCYGVAITATGGTNPGDFTVTARLRNCVVEGLGGLEHFSFDTQTANFTIGATLSGASATATVAQVDDSGATGTVYFRNRTGTFTLGETITDSSGGSARMSNVMATSSYAYDVRGVAPAVINGTMDACWKTGGLLRWGNAGGVQYASNLYNNVAVSSNASTAVLPP